MVAATTPSGDDIIAWARSFFAALDDHRNPAEKQRIYDFVAAHVRSAAPMSFALPDPALAGEQGPVVRPLRSGARYELTRTDDQTLLYLVGADGHDVDLILDEAERAVMAKDLGVGR
jgi:hypothetical protein